MRTAWILLAALVPLAAGQTIWHVQAGAAAPGTGSAAQPFPAIQPGIDAAASGDTVLVGPGTYPGILWVAGKSIAIRGSGGSSVTTIDAQQAGSAIVLINALLPQTVIEGLTVTGGHGLDGSGNGGSGGAGGILCIGSSPVVRNCFITGNQGGAGSFATVPGAGGGGGILAHGGHLTIEDSTISTNAGGIGGVVCVPFSASCAAGSGGAGGIHSSGTVSVLRSRIESNSGGRAGASSAIPYFPFAAGVRGGAGGIDARGAVAFCTVSGNLGGAGEFSDPSQPRGTGGAGGIRGELAIQACIIESNQGGPGYHGGAGGVHVTGAPIVNALVRGNTGGQSFGWTFAGPGIAGAGGVELQGGRIVSSVVAYNTGGDQSDETGGPGGIRAVPGGSPTGVPRIVNVTVWGNTGGNGPQIGAGGVRYGNRGAPPLNLTLITGSIVRANAGFQISVPAGSGAAIASHSDVQGGLAGPGNIDADPLLADPAGGDFHLLPLSPCIDAGDSSAPELTIHDVEGDPRIFHGFVDIGADETVLTVRLIQPGGPGAPVLVTNGNLDTGHEYYNLFSVETCAAGLGTGPFLGLCAGDPAFLAFQFSLPAGAEPIHFLAQSALQTFGPYPLPPLTVEAVCFDWTGQTLGPVSHVVSFQVN